MILNRSQRTSGISTQTTYTGADVKQAGAGVIVVFARTEKMAVIAQLCTRVCTSGSQYVRQRYVRALTEH